MHHRAILLGAELQIDSEMNKGTNIRIKLPINLENNENQ
jgi:signal transduction histidine kinase